MNLDHFKDPDDFVSGCVDDARRQIQEKYGMPDWAIDSLVFCVEDDGNGVTYGCAGLAHTKWDTVPSYCHLLMKVVAAGGAYLDGPESWHRAARYEFESVFQRWSITNEETTRKKIAAKKGAMFAKEKANDLHNRWFVRAVELEQGGMNRRNIATRIANEESIEITGATSDWVRKMLKGKGFYRR